MYFAPGEIQRSSDEIYTESVDYLQTYFQADQSYFELPRVFGAIEMLYPDDEDLANFALDLNINSRAVAALQAETYNRRTAAKIIANSLADETSVLQDEIIERASHAGSGAHRAQFEKSEYEVMQVFDLDEFKVQGFGRTRLAPYPLGMNGHDWERLPNRTHGKIIREITEHTERQGDSHLERRLASTAVRLICGKEIIQSHTLIATGASRVYTAHHVLRAAGDRYDQGVISVSDALSRGNHIDAWDTWQDLSTPAIRQLGTPHKLRNEHVQTLLEDGMILAVRNRRPDAALNIVEDIFDRTTYGADYQPGNNPLSRIARALSILAMQHSKLT